MAYDNDFEKLALEFGNLPGTLLAKAREELLPEAGRIMAEYQRGTIQQKGIVDTGQLRDSVRSRIPKEGDRVNVAPVGRRKPVGKKDVGERNAAVAFIQHYTDGKGKGWIDDANKAAEEDVFNLAERRLGEILDGWF